MGCKPCWAQKSLILFGRSWLPIAPCGCCCFGSVPVDEDFPPSSKGTGTIVKSAGSAEVDNNCKVDEGCLDIGDVV